MDIHNVINNNNDNDLNSNNDQGLHTNGSHTELHSKNEPVSSIDTFLNGVSRENAYTTSSSLYQDSETTYYDLCTNNTRLSEYDEKIVIQNLHNKRNEKLSKPCENGFCYCYTSDSGEIKFNKNSIHKINQKPRHKVKKQSQTNNNNSNNNNNTNTNNSNDNSEAQDKLLKLATKTQNISPYLINKKISESELQPNNNDGCLINKYQNNLIKKKFNPPLVKNRVRETYDSNPNAPFVRIVQEIHNDCVVSEIQINRDKVASKVRNPHYMEFGIIRKQEKNEQDTNNQKQMSDATTSCTIPLSNKNIQTEKLCGSGRSSRSSGSSNGGRLLLKRIGNEGVLKLRNAHNPPKKPPRRRFSSPSKGKKPDKVVDNLKEDEKFKKNPYRRLRQSLPTEVGINLDNNTEDTQNYQETTPSCPTLSDLSSTNTVIPNSTESNDYKVDPVTSIGWVPPNPDIVNMIHYETKSENHFDEKQSQPEPQQQKPYSGWIIPPKKDIDTVDNVRIEPEAEFNNFASSMENKSTPVKTQILPQDSFTNTTLNKSQKAATNDEEKLKVDPKTHLKLNESVNNKITNTKLTTNKNKFIENSKKLVRFVFGMNNENINSNNGYHNPTSGRTVATQTFNENELSNLQATSTILTQTTNIMTTTTSATTQVSNISNIENLIIPETTTRLNLQPVQSIYPSMTTNNQQFASSFITEVVPLCQKSGNFDFNRKIDSPKQDNLLHSRLFHRKLKFSPRKALKGFGLSSEKPENEIETYKSYISESVDGDFCKAAMNNILTDLENKIETENKPTLDKVQHNIIPNKENHVNENINDNDNNKSSDNGNYDYDTNEQASEECIGNVTQISAKADIHAEPIYSEIEEHINQIHINENVQKVTHVIVNNNPSAIYAKVNKNFQKKDNDHEQEQQQSNEVIETECEKKIVDSITSGKSFPSVTVNNVENFIPSLTVNNIEEILPLVPLSNVGKPLPLVPVNNIEEILPLVPLSNVGKPLPLIPVNNIESVLPLLPVNNVEKPLPSLPLNNIGKGVKSTVKDESLSELRDNWIYRINIDQESENEHYHEWVYPQNNDDKNISSIQNSSDDDIYEDIDEFFRYDDSDDDDDSYKTVTEIEEFNLQYLKKKSNNLKNSIRCKSCPLPHIKYDNRSLSETYNQSQNKNNFESDNDSPMEISSTKSGYNKIRNLKSRLQLSFRKANILKQIYKHKNPNKKLNNYDKLWKESNLCLNKLYQEIQNDSIPVENKIGKVVSICRQMPQFENSRELVEAERLLLYSALLKRKVDSITKFKVPPSKLIPYECQQPNKSNSNKSCIQINNFEISVKSNEKLDMFFNYYFITAFTHGNIVKSTKSVQKQGDLVLFSDCNIIFEEINPDFCIRAYIYVLRLRKICNLNFDTKAKFSVRKKTYTSSSDSSDELISRFRLKGTFIILPQNFAPYCLDNIINSNNPNEIYLKNKTKESLIKMVTLRKSSSIQNEIKMNSNIELVFEKFELKGVIYMQSDLSNYVWGRKWCELKMIYLCFWDYQEDSNYKEPLTILDLTECITYPVSTDVLCSKLNTFTLQFISPNFNNNNNKEEKSIKTYFFSTENQSEYQYWINSLNEIINFTRTWMH